MPGPVHRAQKFCGAFGPIADPAPAFGSQIQVLVPRQVQLGGQVVGKRQRAGGAAIDKAQNIGAFLKAVGGEPGIAPHLPAVGGGIAQRGVGMRNQPTGHQRFGAAEAVVPCEGEGPVGAAGVDGEVAGARYVAGVAAVGGDSGAVFHAHVAA